MLIFDFNRDKSQLLKRTHGISFEEISVLIETGHLVKTIVHPNRRKYPEQSIYLVEVDGYVYVVPWVRNGETIFLKTIFASRKATKQIKRGDPDA